MLENSENEWIRERCGSYLLEGGNEIEVWRTYPKYLRVWLTDDGQEIKPNNSST